MSSTRESEARQGWADLLATARHYLPIAESEAYERLGLTPPKEGEELIGASPPSAQPAGGEFRGRPAASEFAASNPDPFEQALEAAIAAADNPGRMETFSQELARPLLAAAEKDPEIILGPSCRAVP